MTSEPNDSQVLKNIDERFECLIKKQPKNLALFALFTAVKRVYPDLVKLNADDIFNMLKFEGNHVKLSEILASPLGLFFAPICQKIGLIMGGV